MVHLGKEIQALQLVVPHVAVEDRGLLHELLVGLHARRGSTGRIEAFEVLDDIRLEERPEVSKVLLEKCLPIEVSVRL